MFTKVAENLKKLGYQVSVFDTKEQAADYLCGEIKDTTVGFGGSITLRDMGLYDRLQETNKVAWHMYPAEGQNKDELRMLARNTDVYLTSANGLAETGEIINIDGAGNRVSESIFGHKKVYFVIGKNKLAEDYDKALWRARNIAGPKNAQRLGRKTPCAAKGDRCYNCSSPDRICKVLSVFWGAPMGADCEVVLIKEDLGY
ncbi:MAG: lactate utilization protein [Clostridia bacterium]|nr:lactate utilization protein [Clostridia bacterium]